MTSWNWTNSICQCYNYKSKC